MLTAEELNDIPGFDVIGDVHGCAQTLTNLLERMDYRYINGCWRHRSRIAVFVGDIVDRGPHIREALDVVYSMVDRRAAVCIMGNHEYNAVGYCTPAPPEMGRHYLREHNNHHNRLIAETLEQFAAYPVEWREYIEWFTQLPLFFETDHFRVVHACWDEQLIRSYLNQYHSNYTSIEFITRSVIRDSFEGRVMDRLTRGTDLPLPEGRVITSRDGYQRRFFRTKFWAQAPETYADVVFQPDPLPEDLLHKVLSTEERDRLLFYGHDQRPLFIGHYWLQGTPKPIRSNIACLDYSAVKFGRLAAYRFDREEHLDEGKFVWVYVDPPEWRQPEPE
ncbi:metallophosphoesterase [Halioxenophilus sp. WMMB6]|uniref:metallophosphoesterase n=1 Tax=Halioxenophilus sp. WMMB6 TaxID=3073815 RepID=UPI00295E796B|nr:metallophosphoesterase [Halioxenophilus sp. WMMB6]